MGRITEDLVRKRAEHNDGFLHSLEELSLHQLDIERIENLDKWCPRLKILYLQGNLISRIGCESLEKLDLTVNFIWKLSGLEDLKDNYNLKELYLMGNPCASYSHYRQYVIINLAQLAILDGKPIGKEERVSSLKNSNEIEAKILEQEKSESGAQKDVADNEDKAASDNGAEDVDDATEKEFWAKKSFYTPESRLKLHRHLQRAKDGGKDSISSNLKNNKKAASERKFTAKDGRMLNINEPKVGFEFSEAGDALVLDVAVYRYLDTSLLQVDVQPNYVQIFIKRKLLQLVLETEVKPDQSIIQRSQTTGHLIVKMPKVGGTFILVGQNSSKVDLKKDSQADHKISEVNCDLDVAEGIPELI